MILGEIVNKLLFLHLMGFGDSLAFCRFKWLFIINVRKILVDITISHDHRLLTHFQIPVLNQQNLVLRCDKLLNKFPCHIRFPLVHNAFYVFIRFLYQSSGFDLITWETRP